MRLLDFEYGAFRHALYDMTAWNILCPLPRRFLRDMAERFRAELGYFYPAANDEVQYNSAWAALCAFRALAILSWIDPDVLQENRPWVDENWTSRHAVLAAVSRLREATENITEYRAVSDVADRLLATLQREWSELAGSDDVTPKWTALREVA